MAEDERPHETVPVELTILGARVRGEARVPSGPVPLEELLPVFRLVEEAVVGLSIKSVEQHGKKISCCKGCGACCRQAVPVSLPEARRLKAVVEAMEEPRRSEVLAKFGEIERRVTEAGLMEALLAPDALPREEIDRAPMLYFRMGMACPFLVEESCGIYEERPLACREYLVTSPAKYCAAPDERVEVVRLPYRAAEALARMEGTEGRKYVRKIPLGLALKWCREHPEAGRTEAGGAAVREFMRLLDLTQPKEEAGKPPGTPRK